MNVGDLKKDLENFPDDMQVVLSRDVEGNGYSPLAFVGEGIYEPYNTYSGEFYSLEDTDDDGERVIAFWPVN